MWDYLWMRLLVSQSGRLKTQSGVKNVFSGNSLRGCRS